LRRNFEDYLAPVGARLAAWRIQADALTASAFILTAVAVFDIAHQHFYFGLGFLTAARLADVLGGAVARRAGPTAFGAALDRLLGAVSAGAVPFAFALAEPERALAAMFLMLGLVVRAGAETFHDAKPAPFGFLIGKSELFLAFAAACLFPNWFSVIAYGLGILCFVAAGSRLAAVSREP
jgi:phosphatidylglycerophosphate synthase